MERISLREYNREIDGLIRAGQNSLAIQHCRQILKIYPKHISTYRLLGRAYIESQLNKDAADIFLRLLSSLPDELIAHVGLSAIREDEGQIPGAIWHMERAFEIQPASSTLGQELSRLYGKRDNSPAHQVSLTHAALARMFLLGGLYPQAVAELRIALAENKNRFDLEVWLAASLIKLNQTTEANNICREILVKLPYCLEANRLLALASTDNYPLPESETCWQRLNALDPYYAYTKGVQTSPDKVPDGAVTLEKTS